MEKTVLITVFALFGIALVLGVDVFYGVYAELSFDKQGAYPSYQTGESVLVTYSFKNHVFSSKEIIDPGIQVSCSYNIQGECRECKKWRRCIRYTQNETCLEWETVEYQCDGCECTDWRSYICVQEKSDTIYSSPSGQNVEVGPLRSHTKSWTFPAQLQQKTYSRCELEIVNCPAEKCSARFNIYPER